LGFTIDAIHIIKCHHRIGKILDTYEILIYEKENNVHERKIYVSNKNAFEIGKEVGKICIGFDHNKEEDNENGKEKNATNVYDNHNTKLLIMDESFLVANVVCVLIKNELVE